MISKLSQDLSNITGIPKLTLDNLNDKIISCIGHAVYEASLNKEPVVELDLGFGILYIKMENLDIKYKFIPNTKLESLISFTILNKESPLVLDAEKSLKTRIEKTYKELL